MKLHFRQRRQETSRSTAISLRIMRLLTAMLYVKDMQSMKRFYSELLGAGPDTKRSSVSFAVFDTGVARFALHEIPAELARNIEIASPPIPREHDPVKLIFDVEDVEETRARLESHGAQVLRRLWQKPGEACDMADPEGNIFQLSTPSDPQSALRETAHGK